MKKAIAEGIKKGYAALYEADESAHSLPADQLKGLVAQVSGTEEAMTKLIALTFGSFTKLNLADFTTSHGDQPSSGDGAKNEELRTDGQQKVQAAPPDAQQSSPKFHPKFRFNIEVHLPSNGTEETYLNIFNALRKSLA